MAKEKKKGCGCSTILVGFLCFLCFAMIFGNTEKDDSDQPAAKQTSSSVQAAATSTPRKSASPTQTPTATPVPTEATINRAAVMAQLKTEVEGWLKDLFDYYYVEVDETGMIINVAMDGLAREVYAAKVAGDQWDSTAWDTMRQNLLDTYNALYSLIETAGVKEPSLMLTLLNDKAHDNVFLGIAYGTIIYDVMAE